MGGCIQFKNNSFVGDLIIKHVFSVTYLPFMSRIHTPCLSTYILKNTIHTRHCDGTHPTYIENSSHSYYTVARTIGTATWGHIV